MRRFTAITSVFSILIVVFVAGFARGTATQNATPDAANLPPLIQAWIDTYEAEDAAAFAALFTPDGIYEDVPAGHAAQGTAEIIEFVEGYFEGQDDYVFVPTTFYQGEGWAVLEFLTSATDAASGIRIIDVPIATVFELEDGSIRRSSDYYDRVGVLEQLGLLPGDDESTEAGTPVP